MFDNLFVMSYSIRRPLVNSEKTQMGQPLIRKITVTEAADTLIGLPVKKRDSRIRDVCRRFGLDRGTFCNVRVSENDSKKIVVVNAYGAVEVSPNFTSARRTYGTPRREKAGSNAAGHRLPASSSGGRDQQ